MVESANTRKINTTILAIDSFRESLVSEGLITQKQLKSAEEEAKQKNKILGKVLLESGYVTEEQLYGFIGEKVHIPYINITNYTIDLNVLKLIPERIAGFYNILPLFEIENSLTIAMADPLDTVSLKEISEKVKFKIETVLASEEGIKAAIDKWYSSEVSG